MQYTVRKAKQGNERNRNETEKTIIEWGFFSLSMSRRR